MEILLSVVGSVAGKIAEYTVERIKRQFGYLVSYETNVQGLMEEVKKLDDLITRVHQLVDAEERNLRDPLPGVQRWLEEARQTTEEIDQFLSTEVARLGNGRCLNGWCPDLRPRYSVSRKAKKKIPIVVQLIQNGGFPADQIACPALPSRFVSTLTITTQAFLDFESRVSIMDKVMEALRDDNVNMIRICGIGGVGKTTMVNKIVNKVREGKLFDEVAMAVVSQTPDFKKIRDEIADQLDLKLDRQSENGRAAQLHERIVRIKKILLVLDDVWDVLELADIGLPSGLGGAVHTGYKILFTSRREDVYLMSGIMRHPTNFVVPTLSEEEAWSLFEESAGNCCGTPDIQPIAKQIVNECSGLPIAIVTVGNTLGAAGNNKHEWSDVLRELKSGIHGNKINSCINLSYNYLKCEELQGLFLLCCLFPEDADIPVENLLRYGMGLGLLKKGNYSIEYARNRVHMLVGKLSRIFLLLPSKLPWHVKMHDVVRDVGISIASEDRENGLMNTCIYYEKSNSVLLEKLAGRFDHTNLKLLWLSEVQPGIPLNFFEGMKKLNVLALSDEIYNRGLKLPPLHFHGLEDIKTLCLEYNDLQDIDLSAIGALGSLEILSFYGSRGICLPSKLGLLTRLRLLDCRCHELQLGVALKIEYDVLSGLKHLEELYLDDNMDWEVEEEGKQVVNATVAELKCLPNLTSLSITLPKAQLINPKDMHFEKLIRFRINMGCKELWWHQKYFRRWKKNDPFSNCLAIGLKGEERIDQHMGSLINILLKTTEVLYVDGGTVPFGNSINDAEENLFDLQQMSLKKGFNGPSPSFSQLRSLYVTSCNMLKYVLPLNVASALLQLESLQIRSCRNVEEVFYLDSNREGDEGAASTITVKLPQLTDLELNGLRKFTTLCKSTVAFDFPELTSLELRHLYSLKRLFKATHLSSKTEVAKTCIGEVLFDFEKLNNVEQGKLENTTNTILPQLEKLYLDDMPNLKHVWKNGAQVCQGFQTLKILIVCDCANLENIIGEGDEEEDKEGAKAAVNVLFPQLVELRLIRLPNLVSFLSGNKYTLEWMSMKELSLNNCPKMKTFISGVVNHTTQVHLFNEYVNSVDLDTLLIKNINCEVIWHCKTQVVVRYMTVSGCHKLKNVLISSCDGIKRVETLVVSECESLGVVFQFDCEQEIFAAQLSNGLESLELTEAALTHNIRSLNIHSCPSLQRVFCLYSTARSRMFPQLYNLEIRNCPMMEEIFALKEIDDEATTSAAPTLSKMINISGTLNLENNANLKRIFKGIDAYNAVEFSLHGITINGCPKLGPSSFYFSLLNSSKLCRANIAFENQKASVSSNRYTGFMFIDGVENLMDMLMLDGKCTPPRYFSVLHSLELKNLLNFPPAAWLHFLQSFPKLETLAISNCGSVEVIFGFDLQQNVKQLPHLTELKLSSLEKLSSIWMKGIPRILSQRFENLKELYVEQCHSLRNLLTPSMAKHLVKLATLTVENCNVVKEIVSVEEMCVTERKVIEEIGMQEDEGEEINKETITLFPQVKNLTLKNLPNLTSLCATQGYTFNWPSLTKVVVSGCPRLVLFTVSNTPKLKEVETEYKKCPLMQDLDATIQPISKEEVTETAIGEAECYELNGSSFAPCQPDRTKQLQNLQVLEVGSYPNMDVLFDLENMEQEKLENATNTILPRLEELYLHDLPKLKHVWKNGAQACQFFQNLKILEVRNCESMEHIVGQREEEELIRRRQEGI